MAMTKVPKSYYAAAEKLRIAGQFNQQLRLLKNKK